MAQINVGLQPGDTIATYPGNDPTISGVYLSVLADDAGVAGSRNHLSLFNPVGSGKVYTVLGVVVSAYSVASVNSGASLNVYRTTTAAPSGGTTVTPQKFLTSFANSGADVRTGNPTVNLLNSISIGSFAPPFGATGVGGNISSFSGASFNILPGEGVVFQCATGNVNNRWNIEIIWAER